MTLPQSLVENPRLERWLRFNADGTVSAFSGKVEIGQGIGTALAQIAADELGLKPAQLAIVAGDTRFGPDEWYTSGSLSIEVGGESIRLVCAEVRELFREAAARELEVDAKELELRAGAFEVPGTDLRRSYWELAPKVSLARDATGSAAPRAPASGALVGTRMARRDLPAKLVGGAYIYDMAVPGMLHARVLHPPRYGARLVALDEAAVRAAPGVAALVRSGSFVAVAAQREEQAVRALEIARRAAQWEGPAMAPFAEVAQFLTALPARSSTVHSAGTPSAGVRHFEALYSRPYLAHASIGPSCALALPEDGRLRIWSHAQGPHILRREIAKALGIAPDAVEVVHHDGAGCYGHNGADDAAFDAALVARACGQPVMLQWTREDELAWAPFGAGMAVKIGAEVDASGTVVAWKHELWSQTHVKRPGRGEGIELLSAWHLEPPAPVPAARAMPLPAGGATRNAVPGYAFAHQEVVHHFVADMPIRTSALRSLGAHANVFAIESMIDEIAAALGADPLAYRLRHLADERAKAVLGAAAEAANWQAGAEGGAGTGRGLGFARYKNRSAYCAVILEVEAAEKLRVRRAVAAVDAGRVVNPDGLENQIEGGIVQALSWSLKEQVRWTPEGIATRGWAEYPILAFDEVPEISVVLVERPEAPSLGVGECAAGPTAAALANALHHALGVRARHLPLTPERIAAAIG